MITDVRAVGAFDRWCFLHVPKTAGTSLIAILDSSFRSDAILPEHDFPWNFRDVVTTNQLRGHPFVRGHFFYDDVIPRLGEPRPALLTVLRDPSMRFISNIEMRRVVPDPAEGLREKLASMTLDQILDDEDVMERFANRTAKYIGGFEQGGKVATSRAIDRLATFDHVGLTEQFRNTVRYLTGALGVPEPSVIPRLNVTHPTAADLRRDMTECQWARVREANSEDWKVYLAAERIVAAYGLTARSRGFEVEAAPVSVLDLDRMYPGQGWHVGEPHPLHRTIRWSGPEPTALLHFPGPGSARMRLTLHVVNKHRLVDLRQTSLAMGDRQHGTATVVQKAGWTELSWALDGVAAAERTLAFRVTVNRVGMPLGDARTVGICISHAELSAGST